jgi:hypothetical protein
MVWRRSICLLACLAVWGMVSLPGSCAFGRETEEQLLERIQREHNPVKKAKYEIKLANLKLKEAQDAYKQRDVQLGSKLLEAVVEHMKSSWKILQESGRQAAKQPQGFKELDISLRQDGRLLEDLRHRVAYFDRGPVDKAAQEMERIRSEVLQALFPTVKRRAPNPPAAPKKFVAPGTSSEMWSSPYADPIGRCTLW